MGLRMASVWKHPTTGTYYLRERVPADLVVRLRGRKVSLPVDGQHRPVTLGEFVKLSLNTKEPKTAKALHRDTAAAVEELWQRIRQEDATGPVRLTAQQVEGLAGQYYREIVDTYGADPGDPEQWELDADGFASVPSAGHEKSHGEAADRVLASAGLAVNADSRKRLLSAMNRAAVEALHSLYKRAKGDYSPDPNASRFPDLPTATTQLRPAQSVTLTDLFGLWKADHLLQGGPNKTVKDFRQKLDSLTSFLGHEDAQRVTAPDISAWTEHLRHKEKLGARTVASKYLVAVKRVYTVGQRKFRVSHNPAKDVVVEVPKLIRTRSPGFTAAEATAILKAALGAHEVGGKTTEHTKLARRWGPWLCAYTGARVGEMMQLRKQDVEDHEGISCLRITPEFGTVKAGSYRMVPIHPHLVEMGFLEMVKGRPDGPLFYDPKAGKGAPAARAGHVGGRLADWVRDTAGVTDKRLQPNHAWRHRFATVAREVGMTPDKMEAIQGHEDGRATTGYGEFSPTALATEIRKLPRYDVG